MTLHALRTFSPLEIDPRPKCCWDPHTVLWLHWISPTGIRSHNATSMDKSFGRGVWWATNELAVAQKSASLIGKLSRGRLGGVGCRTLIGRQLLPLRSTNTYPPSNVLLYEHSGRSRGSGNSVGMMMLKLPCVQRATSCSPMSDIGTHPTS
jgi:hypothetical protein